MGSLSWVVVLLLGELTSPSPRHLVPRRSGAESYESRPAQTSDFAPFGDPLRTLIQKAAAAAGRKQGTRVVPDARLDAAMTDLARALREGESPHGEAVDFVLSHYGIVEPYPTLDFIRARPEAENAALDALIQKLELPAGKPLATIGIGLDRDTSTLFVIVAIQDKSLDLDAVPRQLPHDGRTRVSGKLLGRFAAPHLYVTDPRGAARTLPAEMSGPLFNAEVRCDRGDGRYQVEVFGSDETGPRVLANFAVYCGLAPPSAFVGAAGYARTSLEPREAEARLLELVNQDRRAAGLPALAPDPALATVAREHSMDMVRNKFIGHISPTTGGPVDRAKSAGISFKRLSENVGRNGSVEELELGLMASPGHRSAILDAQATRVGIGIVIDEPTPDAVVVIGTQMFR